MTIQLPANVELKITETEPGVRGNTVNNTFKPATVETGLVVKVPMHINKVDLIRVNTETGEFLVNPTYEERDASDLDLELAGSSTYISMLEAGAKEISEEDMLAAMAFG